ncbi:MAG: nucleotide exchange factor GrpE, partial [Candidatus Woesebacteria bacterium]|nr:nucleotide exchange factor GrpE [Candidatus Woesebacteria bacterium]
EERIDMYKIASISFISKLLPILDNLRQAQNHLKDGGISIIIVQLESLLKEDGFEEIKPGVGEIFNESIHEVVDTVETKVKEDNNIISEVILSGWKFNGTVIRFAKVICQKLLV